MENTQTKEIDLTQELLSIIVQQTEKINLLKQGLTNPEADFDSHVVLVKLVLNLNKKQRQEIEELKDALKDCMVFSSGLYNELQDKSRNESEYHIIFNN
jgi:hypothetical protein